LLHVTNGDAAAGALRHAGFAEVLPWRDVLHEGPVREGLSREQLSEERARFIAEAGWAPFEKASGDFRARDRVLSFAGTHEEVVLWFEHDLYDQLQLLQLLDGFHEHPHPGLSLVCEAEYVSHMTPERTRERFATRRAVSQDMLREGRDAWAAFRSPDPSRIPAVTKLPFLGAALERHLQEFPWSTDGLSLLERRLLDALAGKSMGLQEIFSATREDPAFLGDLVLQWHLERMAREELVERRGDGWIARGRKRVRRVPRWLGGVLVDERCPWRWDPAAGRIRKIGV
jgi:hypothetical protein